MKYWLIFAWNGWFHWIFILEIYFSDDQYLSGISKIPISLITNFRNNSHFCYKIPVFPWFSPKITHISPKISKKWLYLPKFTKITKKLIFSRFSSISTYYSSILTILYKLSSILSTIIHFIALFRHFRQFSIFRRYFTNLGTKTRFIRQNRGFHDIFRKIAKKPRFFAFHVYLHMLAQKSEIYTKKWMGASRILRFLRKICFSSSFCTALSRRPQQLFSKIASPKLTL